MLKAALDARPITASANETVDAATLTRAALHARGITAAVALRGDAVADMPNADKMILLRQALPIDTLTWACHALDRGDAACLLLFSDGVQRRYGEAIHRDAKGHVRVERLYGRVTKGATDRRLVAAIWQQQNYPRGADTRSVWRELRRVLASGRTVRGVSIGRVNRGFDLRQHIAETLSLPELQHLAGSLGYHEIETGIFAADPAAVSSGAFLRGPLIIDAGFALDANAIQLGPNWLSSESTGCPDENNTTGESHRLDYFVAPAARSQRGYDACKRLFDIFFALAALLATLPISLVVACLIKLHDGGPIFFAHQREGRHGVPFGCIKFRTMVTNAEALKEKLKQQNQVDGPQFKIDRDPRITPIGRFLRKTNVDEVPQFINVLLGEMSVVGPRPSPWEENQLCPAWREARLSVKPGITGLWQVSRSRQRGPADFQEWVFYDTQYVERRGFWLDIRIILLTIKWMYKGQ